MDSTQIIPTHTWTRLDGYDVEVMHRWGANIGVKVLDGKLELYNHPDTRRPFAAGMVECELRPIPGYSTPWRPPIAGRYRLDYNDGSFLVESVNVLTPDMVVLKGTTSFTDHRGETVYIAAEIAMNSGGAVRTEREFGPVMEIQYG